MFVGLMNGCVWLPRWLIAASAFLLAGVLATTAVAQAEAPKQSTQLSWHERYEKARAALLADRFEEASIEFGVLEASAENTEDRKLASELASVARAKLALRKPLEQPELRTSDELVVLYTTAVFYGLGTSGWLTLQLKPQSFGGAILPFAVITPASVAIVALADSYRPLRHGIPHAIAAGLYLGFGEGLWLVGYQSAYAGHHSGAKRWSADRVSTALWATSTGGAVAGTLIGALRRPTPGRVSFTASTTIWGGLLSAFATGGIESDPRKRAQHSYLVGAIGYNVGLVAGLLVGPSVAPSIARVRFTDLGGLGGALLGGGGYALLAKQHDARGELGFAAIGGALGLGLTFWATSGMAPDHSHDQLRPAIGSREAILSSLHPMLAPTRGGFVAGFTGQL